MWRSTVFLVSETWYYDRSLENWTRQIIALELWTSNEQTSACSQNPMEECPEGQRCPGQPDDLQRQPPQSTRAVHSDIWKVMQKASMDEKGTHRRWKQGWATWEEQRHDLKMRGGIKNLERLWNLHSWRYSELDWIWFWATSPKLALCCVELD